MEEQAAAERQRRAAVTKAEGEKQAAILEAEGRLEASRRDAQAEVVLAKASGAAIELVSEAVKGDELPVLYLLGEKYADSLRELSASDNAKTVVLPADLPQAVRAILNKG